MCFWPYKLTISTEISVWSGKHSILMSQRINTDFVLKGELESHDRESQLCTLGDHPLATLATEDKRLFPFFWKSFCFFFFLV